MRKTLYFDCFCGYYVAAITEGGKITGVDFEKRDAACAVGDIYKGKVESILPGMHAAFVNCGLQKNCYLSANDFFPDKDKYQLSDLPEPTLNELHIGDEILVQVVKMPVGAKGARVSAHLSFVGKSLIYMPDTPFVGVSHKIADEELKRNLEYSVRKIISPGEGLVVRTAAPYVRRRQMVEEYNFLKKLYGEILSAAPSAKVGKLLYTDFALPVRILRDIISTEIEEIFVGSEQLKDMIEQIINLYPLQNKLSVTVHNTGRDMFDELGISEQFAGILSPRVGLENGAYLVIERTEALTVIDVNTGRFTGEDSLEQTVYYTNVMAAREIAKQVKLRNIGGIVVVDFIDMHDPAHKKAVVEELEQALKKDAAKCAVSPMSRLGLVEFNRKRTGVSPASIILKQCKHCAGTGMTPSAEFIIMGLRAKLLNAFADGKGNVRIDLNNEVCSRLLGWKEMREDLRARANGAKIYAVPHRTYHMEKINMQTGEFNIPGDAVEL